MAQDNQNKNNDTAAVWRSVDLLIHWLFAFFTGWFFRVWACGSENLRPGRAVVLVCNYSSVLDGLIIARALRRPVRFMVDKHCCKNVWAKLVWKFLKAIEIDDSTPQAIERMLVQINGAVVAGQTVCVFGEGSLSKTGFLRPLKKWVEKIEGDYDLVPAYIGGSWKSSFSYRAGKPCIRFTVKRKSAGVCIGEVMKPGCCVSEINDKISLEGVEYFQQQKNKRSSLGRLFINSARKNWSRKCVCDTTGKELSFGQTLIAGLILADVVKKNDNHDKIGIFLPSSTAGVLANLAVTLAGKIAVNLNYTASTDVRTMTIEQCGIETVITSKIFVSKLSDIEPIAGALYIEDIIKQISTTKKITTFLKAKFLPAFFLDGFKKFNGEASASIIYSSGSSGKPKGVILSHHNIISNIESLLMAYRFGKEDNLCGILPLFHAFGYTCTFWLPVIEGISVCYCPNPLDADAVGGMVQKNNSTFLFATPTFLSTYTRRVGAESFTSLRIVVAGAEKLKSNISKNFEEKFGILPLEGYGATEMSPVAMLNVPDACGEDYFECGAKAGSVGRPIPGLAVKILDMETGEPVAAGCEGIMYCKGPNIMTGYYKLAEKTEDVFSKGWYNTGDVVHIDDDGFVVMLDRLSRFSKIGGEMVPHIAIEDVYMSARDFEEQVLAVTSIPHDRKGEELAVLYTAAAEEYISQIHEFVMAGSLPNLWKPKRSNYFKVDRIPLLGSGKLDVMRLRKLALDAAFESEN